MVVLSREGSRSSSTNIVVHVSDENRVVVCINNTLRLSQPTMLMFPINAKPLRVWELPRQRIMQADDFFQQLVSEEGLFKPRLDADAAHSSLLKHKTFDVQVFRLDDEFYSEIDDACYESREKLEELTRSLWEMQVPEGEELYVVCATAEEGEGRGNVCVEFELPPSRNLIIPGTMQQDLKGGKGEKYSKTDLRVFLSDRVVSMLRGNVADQVFSYIRQEKNKQTGGLTQLFSAAGDQSVNCVVFEDVGKKDLFYLGSKKALFENLCSRVCEVISTRQELFLGREFYLKGGVLIAFNNFQAESNNSLVLS